MPAAISAASHRGGMDKPGRVEDEEVKPYVIVSNLGKGSFAIVYKGYHAETHQEVAIKTIKRSGLNRKLLDNLQSEIDILKSLSHRHITKLIDIVNAENNIYLIMEYCAGGDLTNYIQKRGRVEGLEYIPGPGLPPQYYPHPRTGGLDEIVVRSFLRQLARALRFLRQRNLIHRDIKPQNLLLNPPTPEESARGHPLGVPILKVADFGFARSLPNAMMAETLCGSPLYMAPEILSYKHYDAKVDLWSVGAVLFEMATGKPPFRAQNHIELLKKIERSKGIKFPDEDANHANAEEIKPVPPDVKELIRRLLKREPIERCSFQEFFGSTALAKSKFPRPSKNQMAAASPVAPVPSNEPWPSDEPEEPAVDPARPIPPEVLDPKVVFPPSKFNFKRRETTEDQGSSPTSSRGDHAPTRPPVERAPSGASHNSPLRRPQSLKPLSTEASMIPGETEEDGLLRREYVLVDDTRAVEFNRAVDEISGLRRKPLAAQDNRAPLSPLTDVGANVPYPVDNAGVGQPTSDITFPPPPIFHSPPLSASPTSAASRAATNALSRALSIASKKLFGTGPGHGHGSPKSHSNGYQDYSPSTSSPRRQQIILARGPDDEGAARDPLEERILTQLDDLAQKTDVLTRWADELYEYVKAVPQKPLPDPNKFVRREGEADKQAARRRNADLEAENNAITCIAVYMLVMSFAQKGIDQLRNYQEHMKMRDPDGDFLVSEGFLDALSWFKEGFLRCNSRATLVKTWLPAQYDGPRMWLDHLVYDRALMLSRTAARKELLDEASSPVECKQLYEESIWLLYTLQDDLLQTGNPFVEEDRATVATWITRTRLRLHRCQDRMQMNARDRVQDARADQNLDDVPRIPPPWETVAAPSPARS